MAPSGMSRCAGHRELGCRLVGVVPGPDNLSGSATADHTIVDIQDDSLPSSQGRSRVFEDDPVPFHPCWDARPLVADTGMRLNDRLVPDRIDQANGTSQDTLTGSDPYDSRFRLDPRDVPTLRRLPGPIETTALTDGDEGDSRMRTDNLTMFVDERAGPARLRSALGDEASDAAVRLGEAEIDGGRLLGDE